MILLAPGVAPATGEALDITKSPIRSGSEIDYPPFCFIDASGQANGFSIELMRAALAAMGRGVTFRTGPWSEVRGRLEQGEIQALPLVGRNPERESVFDFTFPYMSLHGAIVVRKGTRDIHALADLVGRRVAVMKSDSAEEFLRREDRGIDIRATATFADALRELSEGRHEAVVVQRLVALRLIQENGLTNLEVVNQPVEGFRQDFCFAVREGDRETLALLNEGLALVMADGTYRHLHAKWFAALQLPTHRRIVIGGDSNYPPYEYLDENGQPAGYNVDLSRAIAREMGLEIEIRLAPWAEIREALAKGEIDAVQGMFYSPKRDLTFDFTVAHALNQSVAVVRKGQGRAPASLDELAGKRIVVRQADIMHDFVEQNALDRSRVTVVPSQEDALRELARGKHDVALVSRLSAHYWIKKNHWYSLEVGRHPFSSTAYCYAVHQNQKALLAQFGEGLKILDENGGYRRIHEKWMGVYEAPRHSLTTLLRYVAMVAIPLLVLLGVFLVWSWSLRRQVASRTKELESSEKRFRRAIEEAPFPIMIYAEDGRVLSLSRAWERITGYAGSEIATIADWTRLAYGEKRESVRSVIEQTFTLRKSRFGGAFEITCKNGSRRIWNFSSTPLGPLPDGRQVVISMAADITDIQHAREHIQHLNNVLRTIRHVNQLVVKERDADALIQDVCQLLVNNRSYSSALIVLADGNDRPFSWGRAGKAASSQLLNEMLASGKLPPCCNPSRSDTKVVKNDRSNVCATCALANPHVDVESQSLYAQLVHEGEVFGHLVAALDRHLNVDDEELDLFSELAGDLGYALHVFKKEEAHKASEHRRESLERQLIQAQKMESVGRLAGGVAHDYNNMLSVIIGHAELALEQVQPDDPVHTDLTEIHAAARRSIDITRQLLAFARRQTVAPRLLDLNATVESTLNMLRRLIGEDIDLAWRPKAGLWPVKVDPTQIDQILANLCVNARDAISDVGKITIETGQRTFNEAYCAEHPGFTPGDFVMLVVSDTGCGMDKDILNKIFEPFFTTKEVGRGTGLGLATVYGIVKQNDGFINVYSEPGQGTSIKVYLSRHDGPVAEDHRVNLEAIPKGRGETVLVVEDEPSILNMAEQVLCGLGYKVLLAKSPAEALQLAEVQNDEISIVITDVVMPEMNGRELAQQLQNLNPGLKCLFMSGYTANVIAHRGILEEGVNFIQKPFSKKDLAVSVSSTLEQV